MVKSPSADSGRLQSDLAALAEFRDPESPGWTRKVFSPPFLRSREWLLQRMRDAGLTVHRDPAGNLIGTLAGPRPALVSGSHTDTVEGGGRFDGPVGVLAALEVARSIQQSGVTLRHELRVVDYLGEEPNDFGMSCIGSRAIAGSLTAEHLGLRDQSERTLAEAIASAGGDPARIGDAAWKQGEVAAAVELHIEQGPVLEDAGVPLAIVTGIVGIERLTATFDGQADHAGTTPMDRRHDALSAAAEAVLALERLAAHGGGVSNTGKIAAEPGALNVVPGHVRIWVELRSIEAQWLDEQHARFEEAAREAGRRRGVGVEVAVLSRTEPVITSDVVRSAMKSAADGLGLRHLTLPSGAGHDTGHMAGLGPVGMLFVPSAGGRSHCPEEWTSPEQLEAGASALLATLLELDRQ